ncbi:MAG: hypothetical protein ACERLM_05170, partial [Acidimicrobiales bacterium]
MKTIKLLLIALGISLTFAACTPAEVQTWFLIRTEGEVELTDEEARAVSDWIISENAKKARLTPTVESFVVNAAPEFGEVLRTYTLFGMQHIWAGIDHLLFVACLILIAGSWR